MHPLLWKATKIWCAYFSIEFGKIQYICRKRKMNNYLSMNKHNEWTTTCLEYFCLRKEQKIMGSPPKKVEHGGKRIKSDVMNDIHFSLTK